MEARNAASPGKADGKKQHLVPSSIPFTLPGAFGLEALAPAFLKLADPDASPAGERRQKGG
jgi:hypothetical protein